MKITEALMAEHTIFLGVFEQIERALPSFTTPLEIATMAGVIENMLHRHAEAEANLAFLALDHALADKGELNRMHQDHHEIDAQLKGVRTAGNCAEARRLLTTALAASRDHFRGEERSVFPLIERVLEQETQTRLGSAWLHRHAEAPERMSAVPA